MTPEEKQKYLEANRSKIEEELTLAKIDILQTPSIKFLAAEIFRKEPKFRTDLPCPTAAANGTDIAIDPEFWSKINRKQKMRVLYHESFHNMMGHCDMRLNSDTEHTAWNLAVDCVTESIATECGVGEGNYTEGVINPTNQGTVNLRINNKNLLLSKCHEKSAEEIYNTIMQHAKSNPDKGGGLIVTDGNGKPINPIDGHEVKESTPEERNDREQRLRQALVEHKLKGTMPGALADMIEKMLKGKINWRAELREMILPEVKAYMTYKRPHRKGLASGLILPTMEKEGVNVGIAEDTSGSIGKMEMDYFNGEVKSLFGQFDQGTVKAKVYLHHTHVYDTVELDDVDDLMKIKTESGGTSHQDVFEKAEDDDTQVLICFTDGYSDFPESSKIRKIIWICTSEEGMEQIPDNLGKKIFVSPNDFKED